MTKYSLLLLTAVISGLSLGSIKTASAAEVIVVQSDKHRHHYVARDGYYWEGPHAYKRVWIAQGHRYDYRPVNVAPRVVVVHDVHDDRDHHDDHDRH